VGIRERTQSSIAFSTDYTVVDDWFPWFNSSGSFNVVNTSLSRDSPHPEFFRSGGTNGDSGGGFDLVSHTYTAVDPTSAYNHNMYSRVHYTGEVIPDKLAAGYPTTGDAPPGPTSDLSLLGLGATAISRCTPTNPSFGLSRSIGELRKDGLPSLIGFETIKQRAKFLKSNHRYEKIQKSRTYGRAAGSEFLNAEFAWAPLVSDLRGFAHTVKGANKIIAQYRKGSDTKIKRRYGFPSSSTSMETMGLGFVQPSIIMGESMWGALERVTSQHETTFSGAFRYHIPLGDDFASKMIRWEQEANKLLGLRLTPKLVWDLAPWTWAIDWFSNTGDVINNISRLGSDGLLMQYGYIMDGLTVDRDLWMWSDAYGTHSDCHSTQRDIT